MKKLLFSSALFGLFLGAQAQDYSEDFEGFNVGDYIGESSAEWTTWNGVEGGTLDAFVVDDNAHESEKSIYVSSTAAGGGPQDIVLEFGQLIDEGLFEMDMWLFIEEGKGAYFNFQGEEAIGTTWALNMFLNQDGEFNVTDSNNENVMTFSYPLGEWFKISYVINFTLNNWSIELNDLAIGAFSNGTNQIASLNVYPLNSGDFGGNGISGMWLDDISWSLSAFEISGLNGALTNVVPNSSGLAGQERNVSVTVNNYGLEDITSFDVTYDYGVSSETENVTGITMASLESLVVDFTTPITLEEGSQDLTITLSNINGGTDDNEADNSSSQNLNPVVPAEGKLVIIEEATGTWCPWCPRGAVMLERMEENYGPYHAAIAVHNSDPMTVGAYDEPFGAYISGYPDGVVDRGPNVDPLGFESNFLERIVVPAAATLDIAADMDEENNILNVSVTYNFTDDVNDQWRVACVLTEDEVTGTGSTWAQANAYAGGAFGDMGGYEDLPSPVPASQMVYDHVARALSPSLAGVDALPATIASGSSYTFNFSFDVLEDWDMEHMHIIGMLIESDGIINNGGKSEVSEALLEDFVEGDVIVGVQTLAGPDSFQMYPNPASDRLYIANLPAGQSSIQIVNAAGALVLEMSHTGDGDKVIDTSGLASGMYLLHVQSDTNIQSRRLVIE